MPRSKRNKVVSLTKTKAKDRSSKTKYIDMIRHALDEYSFVYLFSYDNMRSTLFKDIRMDWRESRIVLGKNSVTQIALGRTVEDEYKDNIRYISERINGNVGLLFTNRSREETERYFKNYKKHDFGKAGTISQVNVILEPGPLPFNVSTLDQYRKLGLVVEVENGSMMLREQFIAAKHGEALTPEQAKLLVHLDQKVDEFQLHLLSVWHNGQFEELH